MKFNWKSLIPLALAIFAPQLAVLSSKTGVAITPITPAMIGNFSFGMIFFSIGDVLPMIQPALLIVGGFLADGMTERELHYHGVSNEGIGIVQPCDQCRGHGGCRESDRSEGG